MELNKEIVQKFVEEYNKQADWSTEIRNRLCGKGWIDSQLPPNKFGGLQDH